MTDYIRQHGNPISFPANGHSWVILSDIERRIKEKIEKVGKPLKDWDIQIYRGILTGCNEAFIIDKQKRDELIKENKKSAEIIRPILRGRDIKRYGYEFADLYLLFVPWHFPLHLDTTITGASKNAEKIFKQEYPAVYNHLFQYKNILSARNTAETGIRYEWYALQRWGANYWNDFSKQKIVYREISNKMNACFVNDNIFINNKSYMITGSMLKYLLGILNSSLFNNIILQSVNITGGKGADFLNQIYVPYPKENDRIASMVSDRLQCTTEKDCEMLDKEINMEVAYIYDLNSKEIEYIENSFIP